jgi:hypothetical protein
MPEGGSRAPIRAALTFAVLVAATVASAGAPLTLTRWDARAVDAARSGASKRLERAECRKLFADFKDARGRTLRQNLEEWSASPAEYVALVPFLDGSSQPRCRDTRTALVASPGVRRVFVCRTFAEFQLRQPGVAESMVIHEILHTLGLGEAPQKDAPTSTEITQRVEARCR